MTSGWVSLTFDDALNEHLDFVVPVLNAAELQGTFYTHLNAPAYLLRQTEWRQAADDGHELGNHTVFHPADQRKSWVRPGHAIDYYSLDRMKLELEFANAVLTALDGQDARTFAYPCSNSFIGHRGRIRIFVESLGLGYTRLAGWVDRFNLDWGSTLQTYEPIVSELFVAGRGTGLLLGQKVPPISEWRRSQLPSVAIADCSISELQHHVDQSVALETWAILQFHGVGGGHRMNCSTSVFTQFISWLKAKHGQRVTTVRDAALRLWPSSVSKPRDIRMSDQAGSFLSNDQTKSGQQ